MQERKCVWIHGKHNVDGLEPNKTKRILLNAIEIEPSHDETIPLLQVGHPLYAKGLQRIQQKLNSYKHQDIKKNIYDKHTMISLDETYDKLCHQDTCHYCMKPIKIIYRQVRDPMQWTLDRLDNTKNHSNDNTVICCLKCNLRRGRIDNDKFFFTKRMCIITPKKKRIEFEPEPKNIMNN
uniref:Uncharacterized protein n=1 Tax=viral metagenome TaxID=1070528 RepID=A0A6C0JXL0_9ZZZZ